MKTYRAVLTCNGKYICYNSFKAEYYLGPFRLSEPFVSDETMEKVIKLFPGSKVKYVEDTYGYYTFENMGTEKLSRY
jgi:hypothetical protein